MKYLSVCSGIEAATQAWHPLGWEPVAFSEIEPFPSAVLAHHYPNITNLGDMTQYGNWKLKPFNVLVGGTPCQSFSVAGLRAGLADPRGNLMLVFGAVAARFLPEWLVWENVPGVLSSHKGRDFASFLTMLAELGYGFAYRVFDTQYIRTCRFGRAIPQRRRRVFVVAHLGDWRPASAVLLEPESVLGNPPPRRTKGQGVAPVSQGGAGTSCTFLDRAAFNQGENAQYSFEIKEDAEVSAALVARGPHAVAARMVSFGEYKVDGTASTLKRRDYKDATDLIVVHGTQDPLISDVAFPQGRNNGQENVIVIQTANTGANGKNWNDKGVSHTIDRASPPAVFESSRVRKLTPVECERLQGFPDNYTQISWRGKPAKDCPDGPRYKALGNSMSVNAMEFIGSRIQQVENFIWKGIQR
jgi:DNA (cytosine-5)-methyltransferase 1